MGGKQSKDKKKRKTVEKSNVSTDSGVKKTVVTTTFHTTTITESRSRSHSFSHSQGTLIVPTPIVSQTLSPAFLRNTPSIQYDLKQMNVRGPIGSTYRTSNRSKDNTVNMIANRFQLSSPNKKLNFVYPPKDAPHQSDLAIPSLPSSSSNQLLQIQVIKNGRRYDNSQSRIPTYITFGKNRGMSFIINNINFKKNPRRGADVDEKNLQNLFQALNITTKISRDLRSEDMKLALKGFAKGNKLKDIDMCFIVIMSHGNGSMDTMTEIAGIDDKSIKVYDVIQAFSNENCPALKGKPKIFLFQCCRGENTRKDEYDTQPTRPAKCEDMLIGYATMPGYVALRNPGNGSPYIRALADEFMTHACDTHIQDMLVAVQDILKKETNEQQSCSFENLAFKHCYLHPV